MKPSGLEQLRKLLSEDKMEMDVAIIKELEVAQDRSVLLCSVQMLADDFEIVARMSWDAVGPEAGIFQFPSVGDIVVVGFLVGDEDEAIILKRLTSTEDKIPLAAVDGHLVLRSLGGKKAFITSDSEINLVRGDGPGTEKLVLGNTYQAAYSSHLEIDSIHDHIGNMGYKTSPPTQANDYLDIKASPVDDNEMLSDLSKTEK